jgi:ABC-2 type transport system permease protein
MKNKLWPNIQKELLLLLRDHVGLLVIFLMPVVLVIVITLVQQNVLASIGETKTKVLFLDMDRKTVGLKIEETLGKSGSLELVKVLRGNTVDVEAARKAVAKGEFQFAIIVPEGVTKAFLDKAKEAAKKSISVGKTTTGITGANPVVVPDLQVYFDPTLRENVRRGITSALEKTLLAIETDEKIKAFSTILPFEIEATVRKSMGSEGFNISLPSIGITWDKTSIMGIQEKTARYGNTAKMPNTVQQNVPAWTLFGMFFVVVPLGSSLIRERQGEMLVRLLTMPQSCLTILACKIISYLVICMMQFFLIIAVGRFFLPLLGTPILDIGSSPAALIVIALSAAAAACGYGILLGTMARTYEQASSFGAVSVVIAAALGGIMVPVFAMPPMMQKISLFSPLSWGLNAFLDVFVRDGNLRSVFPDVALLLLFFLVTTLLAWFNLSRKGHIRIH